MDRHEDRSISGQSVRVVVRRTYSNSRRAPAGSASSVERNCQPDHLVGLSDLAEIADRVRRLTVTDEAAADTKIDLLRMLGRLRKRFP